MKKKKLEL